MKFISSDSSRVIATFSADEIRPESGIVPGDFIRAIIDRYKFLVSPNLDQMNRENFRNFTFRGGGLIAGRRTIEILELTIVDGGVVIDTRNSDDGEFVLDDLFAWATATFGLRPLRTPMKRSYLSSIVAELDERVASKMNLFAEIAEILARQFSVQYEKGYPYSFSKFGFSCDPTVLAPGTVRTEFSIERRANHSFDTNLFYCQSPFPTRTTAELLERVEQLLLRG